MKEIVIATRNQDKKKELQKLLSGENIKVLSLKNFPKIPRVCENQPTFEGNARKKALPVGRHTKKLTLADDSGLEVDALDGRPGIFSSRFSGQGATYSSNNAKLLKLLNGVPRTKRRARFVCSLALADKNGLVAVVRGTCRGYIGFSPKGKNGFGYDPLFVYPRFKKTFAQIKRELKNKVSHRGRALRRIKKSIAEYFQTAHPDLS